MPTPIAKESSGKGVLVKIIMKNERISKKHALFFFKLILPFCNSGKSDAEGDPRINYYSRAKMCPCKCARSIRSASLHVHSFSVESLLELVKFDGVLIRDRSLGFNNRDTYRFWKHRINFDDDVHSALNHSMWLQIKRVKRLNDNGKN